MHRFAHPITWLARDADDAFGNTKLNCPYRDTKAESGHRISTLNCNKMYISASLPIPTVPVCPDETNCFLILTKNTYQFPKKIYM